MVECSSPAKKRAIKLGVLPIDIVESVERVIYQSACSARQFYWGLVWRVLERGFEVLPFLLCYFWLNQVFSVDVTVAEKAVIETANIEVAGVFACLLFITFICQLICSYLGQQQSFLGSYRIMAAYREQLIDRVRQLPLGSLYQYRSGQLADILTDDVKRIESIFTHLAADLFSAALMPLILLFGLLWLDWRLSLSLIIGLPLALWVLNSVRYFFSEIGRRKQDKFRQTAGILVEFVTGIKTLQLFNCADVWLSRLNRNFDDIKHLSLGLEAWGAGPVLIYRLLVELGLVFFLIVCSQLVTTDHTILKSLLFLLLAYKLLGPLLEVAEHLTVLRFAVQSEKKTQALFAGELLAEPDQCVKLSSYDITFDNVCFAYDETLSLSNIDFEVKQNTITAIVGPSGSGKSSLMNLLARFYDPCSGVVRLGGHDLKAIGTEQLYDKVSIVFQQVQLYDASVIENIKIGRLDSTHADVVAACQSANCHDFIMQLPQGYNTRIGEGGTRLSGGERQRLSIARALLKNAPILLLDEATASVDSDSQYEIQRALNQLVVGRTVIMVAHRLSTVKNANQIIVLDEGRIVEKGSHQNLIHGDGLYKKLWHAQSESHTDI